MLGGEALAPDVAQRLLSSGRIGLLLNCYGPTECTVCVTLAEVTAPVPSFIPIGRPVPGTKILILDEHGEQLPHGEVGEICILGRQVTRGYVNDPAGTAERFVAGPSPAEPQRYYRTGDLGYRVEDGIIYFVGRADRQVKINGIRIELAEVDAALRSHAQISDAATIARDDNRTVAYVVPTQANADIDIADVKKHLSKVLPRFMLPTGIVAVAELPQTVNGKLDTSALPGWSPSRPESDALTTDIFDEITARVAQIVAGVTGFVGQIRPTDDFIDDLGGTSLGIVRVLVELERYSARRIRISDALADKSVAGLASLVRDDAAPLPADFSFNTNGDAPPLFLIHAYLGGMLAFRRLAELLPPNQPVYGLHVTCDIEHLDDNVTVTISSLAEQALNRIREVQPAGQVTMVGHSAGGLIVFEAARRIIDSGGPEPRVLLLDAPRPYSTIGYYWGESLLYWRDIVRNPARILQGAATKLFRAVRPNKSIAQIASHADDLMTLTERQSKSVDSAIMCYKPHVYSGSIAVMRTRQGQMMALGRRHLGWASVTRGTIRLIDIPGAHLTILDELHIHTVTEKLLGWLSGE
jgi:thioesterase domain-containing protein/acyl carrier protein